MNGDPAEMYKQKGELGSWGSLVEKGDPDYGKRLFDLLTFEKILPEKYDDFRFLSLSANKGTRELAMIKLINEKIEEGDAVGRKPLFLLSDICREAMVVSGADLENVRIMFVNSDAADIPVEKNTINIMFDRMGAVWYKAQDLLDTAIKINGKIPDWQQDEVEREMDEFLLQCRSKLLSGGFLVLDDPLRSTDDPISTVGYLSLIYKDIPKRLETLGYTFKNIGNGEDRFAVLAKNKNES